VCRAVSEMTILDMSPSEHTRSLRSPGGPPARRVESMQVPTTVLSSVSDRANADRKLLAQAFSVIACCVNANFQLAFILSCRSHFCTSCSCSSAVNGRLIALACLFTVPVAVAQTPHSPIPGSYSSRALHGIRATQVGLADLVGCVVHRPVTLSDVLWPSQHPLSVFGLAVFKLR